MKQQAENYAARMRERDTLQVKNAESWPTQQPGRYLCLKGREIEERMWMRFCTVSMSLVNFFISRRRHRPASFKNYQLSV